MMNNKLESKSLITKMRWFTATAKINQYLNQTTWSRKLDVVLCTRKGNKCNLEGRNDLITRFLSGMAIPPPVRDVSKAVDDMLHVHMYVYRMYVYIVGVGKIK